MDTVYPIICIPFLLYEAVPASEFYVRGDKAYVDKLRGISNSYIKVYYMHIFAKE